MIDELKEKLLNLSLKKQEVKPAINKLNAERERKIKEINIHYDQLISEVGGDFEKLEQEIYKELIDSFEKVVLAEFDAKRSTSAYSVSSTFKEYRNKVASVGMFPKELVQHLDKVINGMKIEDIVYNIDEILGKYKNS